MGWKSNMLLLWFLGFLLLINKASEEALLHFAAHFGMSYAINTMVYLFVKDREYFEEYSYGVEHFKIRVKGLALSVFFTLLVGFTYKYIERKACQATQVTNCWAQIGGTKSMVDNILGIATGVGTILFFEL